MGALHGVWFIFVGPTGPDPCLLRVFRTPVVGERVEAPSDPGRRWMVSSVVHRWEHDEQLGDLPRPVVYLIRDEPL